MRRREFIAALGTAVAAWPLAARAQQSMPVVGFLDSTAAAARTNRVSAFRQGLSEAGFIDGQNVAIEFRWADNQLDRLPALTADLVRRQTAVIVANGPSVATARAATSTIPIVFVTGGDPVEDGFVGSLNRPGGNVTGVSFTSDPLDPKRLGLLHELVPKPAILGVLWDPNFPSSEARLRIVDAAARSLERQMVTVKARTEAEIDTAFATIAQAGAGALFVSAGPFFNNQRRQLVALAARNKLPAAYAQRDYAMIGGLMSYGASATDAYRRCGIYVGRILKGAKPGELPVELPTKYDLVINLATARTLRIEIPPALRALADEVVE